jgi:3-methyladenine DNA glycosylase/8-oxoguanine DNA glycosylase
VKSFDVEVRPSSPFRLPGYSSEDRVMSVRDGVLSRLLRAEPIDPAAVSAPRSIPVPPSRPAGPTQLRLAVERMRFALGVDDDLGEVYRRFRHDPLLGPLLRRRPWLRPRRRPWAWEALAWAVVKQLIETERAAVIQRRIVGRWGARLGQDRGALRDMPEAETIAGRAPAELASMDLSPGRAIALRAIAREIAAGRVSPGDSAADARLLAIPEIGPWTVQCLGLFGRGDPDSLPAGDLIYLKLVGRLARLGRRATVEEVEEFYAPYEPFRGLAGLWTIGLYR